MVSQLPPIYFYIPEGDFPPGMSEETDISWSEFAQVLKTTELGNSVYCWTLQTYLHLKAANFPCKLVGSLPETGIILAHRSSLPFHLKPQPNQLIISIKADHDCHPYAQLEIVQNPNDLKFVRAGHYIPLWVQPGIIQRNPTLGDRFLHIAYLGIEKNLAPELQDSNWQAQVRKLGLQWHLISDPQKWNDYSDLDAVLAVRRFQNQDDYSWKPATKLYNAWHGNVCAILGCESGFRSQRQTERDYLEVNSLEEILVALQQLRDNPLLRREMVENAQRRLVETMPGNILKQWQDFLIDVAVPTYERWHRSAWYRRHYLACRYLEIKENNLRPQAVYTRDQEIAESAFLETQDWGLIALMRSYRTIKRLLR